MTEIQKIFFSKDNIANLNKQLVQQANLSNLSREGKQEVIKLLIDNMKMVFRSIDSNKVNKNNYPSIFEQFKKHSLAESFNQLKKSNIINNYQQDASNLKFQRDFKSQPQREVTMLDRPISSTNNNPQQLNQQIKQMVQEKQKQPVNFNMGTRSREQQQQNNRNMINDNRFMPMGSGAEASLDQAFRPIVNDINQASSMFETTRGKNLDERIEQMQRNRNNDLGSRPQRPTTPDFLKAVNTNPNKNNNEKPKSLMSEPVRNNGRPDFVNAQSSEFNQGFMGLADDSGANLFDINNIDKPLVDAEIEEDNATFEERLKRLQSARDNIRIPESNGKPDFQKEGPMMDSSNNNLVPRINQDMPNERRKTQIETKNKQEVSRNSFEEQFRERENMKQIIMDVKKQEERKQTPTQIIQQVQQSKPTTQIIQQIQQSKPTTQIIQQTKKSFNSDSMNKIQSAMNQFIKPSQEIQELREMVERLTEENRLMKEQIEEINYDKILELKQQIAEEWSKLSTKTEEIENISQSFTEREIIVKEKENNLKQQMEKYEWLLKTKQIQLEVSNPKCSSSYIYPVNNIDNVIGIKLVSYSLPIPRYNIDTRNNLFKFKLNEEEKEIIIKPGKYTIDNLINYIDNKLKEINENITMSLNEEQLVSFTTTTDDKLEIIQTYLSTNNLGFIDDNTATNPWDLRMDDRIYLYLSNLAEDIPFGVLYFNNNEQICQWTFEKPYLLNELIIKFKDSKGYEWNFNGLSHNLSFVVCKL